MIHIRKLARLSAIAYAQTFFISMNTYFIAHEMQAGIAVSAWMISFIWTMLVATVKDANWAGRSVYATGAMIGHLTGAKLAAWITLLI